MGEELTAAVAVLMLLAQIGELFVPIAHYLGLLIAASATLLATISLVRRPNFIPKVPEGTVERRRDHSETGYLLSQSCNAFPIGLLVLNPRKQIIWSNNMARKWFDDPNLHSLTCKDLLCTDRNCPACIVELALNGQPTHPIVRQYKMLDGPLLLQISAVHVRSSEDHEARVLLIAQDVTAEHLLSRRSSTGAVMMSDVLSQLTGLRGHEMRVHATNVARWSIAIARRLGVTYEEIDRIEAAALIHDIGKLAIPETILEKPGSLTPEERAIVETHPDLGAKIAADVPPLSDLASMIKHHHERWDGTGYPDRLEGAGIPLGARIIAVADVYEAMTSHRPYREALPTEDVIAYLVEARGTAFDAAVVDALLRELKTKGNGPSGGSWGGRKWD
ncbi:MAG TPA: HD-GYP domain-containing protein [Bacillota bacterium]|jgi:putative nucleotidyltransferase with HDIG domain